MYSSVSYIYHDVHHTPSEIIRPHLGVVQEALVLYVSVQKELSER